MRIEIKPREIKPSEIKPNQILYSEPKPRPRRVLQLAVALVLAILTTAFLTTIETQAQLVRVQRGAGVTVNAPFVNVRVPALNLGVAGPGPLLRRPLLPRRRLALEQLYRAEAQPAPAPRFQPRRPVPSDRLGDEKPTPAPQRNANGPEPTLASAAPDPQQQVAHLSPAEVASLDVGGLLNTLHNSTVALHDDLAELSTGKGWQRYLKLPEDALPPPADGEVQLGMPSLKKTLARFDRVAAEPSYAMIASLESFEVAHAALRETVARYDRPAEPAQPVEQETLPTPKAVEKGPAFPRTERSVLKKVVHQIGN